MHEQDKAILQSLVSVAWSDGTFDDREHQMLDALIESFGASDAEAEDIRDYAKTKRDLEDIPLNDLSAADRRNLVHHAIILSWVDGEQHDKEKTFLESLRQHLNIPEDEFAQLSESANERAQSLLEMLSAETDA